MTRPILALAALTCGAALACGAAPLTARHTPEVIYSNTETWSGYGFAHSGAKPPMDGYWIGDDIFVTCGGLLEGLRFSIVHFADSAGHQDPLMRVDAEIVLTERDHPDVVVLGPITVPLSFEPDGLPVDGKALLEVTGLAELGLWIEPAMFVAKLRYLNKAGADASKKPGALGQLLYDPPTTGWSEDMFWFDETVAIPPGDLKDWLWFLGEPACNYYWEISVLEPGPNTLSVTVLPVLDAAAGFEVDPPDDSDPPQGGYGHPLSTPVDLHYFPTTKLHFRNPELMVGGQPRTFLRWFLRGSSTTGDKGTGPPSYESKSLIDLGHFTDLEIVFNTELAVAARKADESPVVGLPVKFTDFKTATQSYPGDPIADIDGQGDGLTPLLRKWDPIDVAWGAWKYDYYQWVYVYTPAELADGTPFLRFELTSTDGTVSDFSDWAHPGRVGLPVHAYTGLVAVYGDDGVFQGDANCDGQLDVLDIDAFVLGLTDLAAWQVQYPGCDAAVLDINLDGRADAFDIDPFVSILVGP